MATRMEMDWDSLEKNTLNLRKPRMLGSFSIDRDREFHADFSQIQFLNKKKIKNEVKLDLNEGLGKVVRKDEDKCQLERLKFMLQWILLNQDKFLLDGQEVLSELNTDFVCYRGCLTMIMCSPYEHKEAWIVKAIKWKKTIYIFKEETDKQCFERKNKDERLKKMQSWGYKFEQYLMSKNPQDSETLHTNEPVIESEEFCCLFRSRLGPFSMVYGAEMDGVEVTDSIKAGNPINLNNSTFVELKTSRIIEHNGHMRTFRKFKCLKWWAQSYLVGISEIICGFRDDSGIVRSLQNFRVSELPRQSSEHWQSSICLNYLGDFLKFCKKSLDSHPDKTVLQFEFNPSTKVIHCSESPRIDIERFLPSFFTSRIFPTI